VDQEQILPPQKWYYSIFLLFMRLGLRKVCITPSHWILDSILMLKCIFFTVDAVHLLVHLCYEIRTTQGLYYSLSLDIG
jgi:hypothetical protein